MYLKLISIVGIFLQIIGVFLLAKSDLLTKRVEEAFDKIPNNPFVERFDAQLEDREPNITNRRTKI